MKWPLCSSAISRMGCQWLGGMLWQWDLAVTLLGLREVICHSAQRRSPNPLHAPSGCRHLALLGYLPGEGSQTYPIIHGHMLPENECLYLWHCIMNSIPPAPALLLSACLEPLVQVWKTECSQLQVNPATIPPPALTSSGTFKCLWAKNSSMSPAGMCFWA